MDYGLIKLIMISSKTITYNNLAKNQNSIKIKQKELYGKEQNFKQNKEQKYLSNQNYCKFKIYFV